MMYSVRRVRGISGKLEEEIAILRVKPRFRTADNWYMRMSTSLSSLKRTSGGRGAFTLIELLVVVLIIAIAATVGLDVIGNTEAGMRADRAAREAVTALKYARMLAITNGGVYGVEFDVTNKRFQVYQTTGSTVVSQSLIQGGSYVINFSRPELSGTTMTATITGDTTNPYDVAYTGMGNTSNSGTVVFSYGGYTRTVTIPAVGEPTIN